MDNTYQSNGYSKSIALPEVPPSVSLSSNQAGTGLQQWFRGLSSTPVPHFSTEAIEISETRWRFKWEYYQKSFREDLEQATIDSITRDELFEHVKRLELEFARLKDRFTEIDAIKASAETATGVQFIQSLMEEQTPAIFNLKTAESKSQDSEELQTLRNQLKAIDRVYTFALQSSDTIHRMKVMEMMASRLANATGNPEASHDLEKASRSSISVRSSLEGSPAHRSTAEPPDIRESQKVKFLEDQSLMEAREELSYLPSGPSIPTSTLLDQNGIGTITGSPNVPESQQIPAPRYAYTRQARPYTRNNSNAAPIVEPAPTQTLSTAASHRSNLVTLSAISFFGAGMAWATVFSGTRGDLVLISWAACCFIVGAVSAASATSLLDADGELLNRYKPVRWTVRLLAIFSTMHVFVGVMLVSAAILELDPNALEPNGGMNGGDFRVRNGRVAGGYSLVISAAVVLVSLVIRHRYSRRTWFV